MSGTLQVSMYSKERNETRVMNVTPVCLVDAERLQVIDAVMVNVSSGGARVLTQRKWRPETAPELLLLAGATQTIAKVVYCEPLTDGRFCIGLQFPVASSPD